MSFEGYKFKQKYMKSEERIEKLYVSLNGKNNLQENYIGILSHEFRNQIVGIDELLKLLLENDKSNWFQTEGIKRYIKIITTSVYEMKEVIENLIIFYRLSKGRINFNGKVRVFREEISELLEIHNRIANLNDGLTIQMEGLNELPSYTFYDRDLVFRSLGNLIFGSLQNVESGIINVKMYVKNNSFFMELKDRRKRMIDVDLETKLQNSFSFRSTGELRLSISKSLIELMKGKLVITSNLKETEFVLYFPLINSKNLEGKELSKFTNALKQEDPRNKEIGKEFAKLHPLKILIVEDNPTLMFFWRKYLVDLGYEGGNDFTVLSSCEESMEFLRKGDNVDVIVSDLNLRLKKTGLDLYEFVKKEKIETKFFINTYEDNYDLEEPELLPKTNTKSSICRMLRNVSLMFYSKSNRD